MRRLARRWQRGVCDPWIDNDPDVSGSPRHKRYWHVRTFLNWVGESGLVPNEPLARVETPEKEEQLPAYLTPGYEALPRNPLSKGSALARGPGLVTREAL